jgi:hypothetical protein
VTEGGEPSFDWGALVPRVIHPMRVAIIEAMLWTGQPLSATDMRKVHDEKHTVGFISYHFTELKKAKAIKQVRQRQVRGAQERFYFLAPPS